MPSGKSKHLGFSSSGKQFSNIIKHTDERGGTTSWCLAYTGLVHILYIVYLLSSDNLPDV
ncbi:MAG: hypothetical protein Q8O99_04860 [bacterium]|nr:hypothetical protein [bacterium]